MLVGQTRMPTVGRLHQFGRRRTRMRPELRGVDLRRNHMVPPVPRDSPSFLPPGHVAGTVRAFRR